MAGYYFCLRCATPHATVESVLPAVYVAPPTEGERIARQAPHAWPLFWTYLGVVLGVGIMLCCSAMGSILSIRKLVTTDPGEAFRS